MTRRGGRPPKLTPEQAHNMRLARSWGVSYDKLARFWAVSHTTARRYCADQCRQHREETQP